MNENLGLAHFWAQGDLVTHAVSILLLLASAASWTVIFGKIAGQLRFARSHARALAAFWSAPSLPAALEAIEREDRSGVLAAVARAGTLAAQAHGERAPGGIGAGLPLDEFVTRALRGRMVRVQAGIERGLTFLASVGATAPFVGLFGTVWGIYHALVGLSGATQVVLDKVAGPVGEALIMTAAGLFVAIPAVLAYNACVRANRLTLAELDGFAHDLHAWLTAGMRLSGEASAIDLAQARGTRGR
ncbi:MAG: MotA/TolQ/ExbB proton channel family protein [Betaproteobacteria bacterium]|nr:MotA/TolQ/ExbB proton channel family protein [Betaproteobacteria bacterium]